MSIYSHHSIKVAFSKTLDYILTDHYKTLDHAINEILEF